MVNGVGGIYCRGGKGEQEGQKKNLLDQDKRCFLLAPYLRFSARFSVGQRGGGGRGGGGWPVERIAAAVRWGVGRQAVDAVVQLRFGGSCSSGHQMLRRRCDHRHHVFARIA